jgi:hypothetical protein
MKRFESILIAVYGITGLGMIVVFFVFGIKGVLTAETGSPISLVCIGLLIFHVGSLILGRVFLREPKSIEEHTKELRGN